MRALRMLPFLVFAAAAATAAWAALNQHEVALQAGWFGLVAGSALVIGEGVTRGESIDR